MVMVKKLVTVAHPVASGQPGQSDVGTHRTATHLCCRNAFSYKCKRALVAKEQTSQIQGGQVAKEEARAG